MSIEKSKLRLEDATAQAKSLSSLLYGSTGFQSLPNADQDNILWLLADLLSEINQIISEGAKHEH